YSYTYDNAGRQTSIVSNLGPNYGMPYVVEYETYDLLNRRTSLSAYIGGFSTNPSAADLVNNYYYNGLSQLSEITQGQATDTSGNPIGGVVAPKRVDLSYNALGQISTMTRYKSLSGGSGNVVVSDANYYDNVGRLTNANHTTSSQVA